MQISASPTVPDPITQNTMPESLLHGITGSQPSRGSAVGEGVGSSVVPWLVGDTVGIPMAGA